MMKHGLSYKWGTNGSLRALAHHDTYPPLREPRGSLSFNCEWGTKVPCGRLRTTTRYPPLREPRGSLSFNCGEPMVPSRTLLYGNLAVPCHLIVGNQGSLTYPPLREPRGSLSFNCRNPWFPVNFKKY